MPHRPWLGWATSDFFLFFDVDADTVAGGGRRRREQGGSGARWVGERVCKDGYMKGAVCVRGWERSHALKGFVAWLCLNVTETVSPRFLQNSAEAQVATSHPPASELDAPPRRMHARANIARCVRVYRRVPSSPAGGIARKCSTILTGRNRFYAALRQHHAPHSHRPRPNWTRRRGECTRAPISHAA